jgi:uncharacterized protein (TIGR02145 family)
MMVDGKWTSDAKSSSAWTEPTSYGQNTSTTNKQNHARSGAGATTGGRGICPPNWHVPTDDEWVAVFNAMETGTKNHQGYDQWNGTDAGSRAKAKCTCASGNCASDENPSWSYASGAAGTDGYNFRLLPSGQRGYGYAYNVAGLYTMFYSSTAWNADRAWGPQLQYNETRVWRGWHRRSSGKSIRCIRDE